MKAVPSLTTPAHLSAMSHSRTARASRSPAAELPTPIRPATRPARSDLVPRSLPALRGAAECYAPVSRRKAKRDGTRCRRRDRRVEPPAGAAGSGSIRGDAMTASGTPRHGAWTLTRTARHRRITGATSRVHALCRSFQEALWPPRPAACRGWTSGSSFRARPSITVSCSLP